MRKHTKSPQNVTEFRSHHEEMLPHVYTFRAHIQNDNIVQLSGMNWRGLSIWDCLYGALGEKIRDYFQYIILIKTIKCKVIEMILNMNLYITSK